MCPAPPLFVGWRCVDGDSWRARQGGIDPEATFVPVIDSSLGLSHGGWAKVGAGPGSADWPDLALNLRAPLKVRRSPQGREKMECWRSVSWVRWMKGGQLDGRALPQDRSGRTSRLRLRR